MTSATEPAPPATTLRRLGARIGLLLLVLGALSMTAQVLANVTQSDDFVLKHLVLDDAVYYCLPARHLTEGEGFSFDGLVRTNGVQPLWAIVVTLLAFVVKDDLILLRITAGLSGLLWMVGGLCLFRFLRPASALAASIAAIGWMAAGVEMRLAFSGMENGMQGFLCGLGLVLARRLALTAPSDPNWRRRAAGLGACAAAMCLNRVEFGLLALFWAGWLARLQWRAGKPLRAAIVATAPYLVPLVFVGAAWAMFSRLYFGEWTPISGSVKAYNASTLPNPFGGLSGSLVHHLGLSLELAALPVGFAILDQGYDLRVCTWILAIAVGLPMLGALPLLVRASATRNLGTVSWPLGLLVGFAAVHLVLVSVFLAPYTSYCSWYFTAQILLVWLAVGAVLARAHNGLQRALALPLVLLVLFAAVQRVRVHIDPPRYALSSTGDLVETGRFCARWLPRGSHIGAMNSGFIALQAVGDTVTNLDGLMNDGRYLRDYLSRDRVDDYIREQGIRYLADNLPVQFWRNYENGIGQRMPRGMKPIFCQRSIADSVMSVLTIPDASGSVHALAPPHPLADVLWRTFVRGEFRQVRDADLATILRDQQVVATFLDPPAMLPTHVVAPRAVATDAVDAAGVAWLPAIGVAFAERVELLAVELPVGPLDPGQFALVTTYWRPGPQLRAGGELELCLRVDTGSGWSQGRALELRAAPAHGTLPLGEWRDGQILAHGFGIPVPATLPKGQYPVWLSVRASGAALPSSAGSSAGRATEVRAGSLQVRRW